MHQLHLNYYQLLVCQENTKIEQKKNILSVKTKYISLKTHAKLSVELQLLTQTR